MRRWLCRMLAAMLTLALLGAGLAEESVLPDGEYAAEETGLPDGEYAPDGFWFSGGSGRVTISCPKVAVEGGAITATLVFSSPNYTQLAVEGVVYAAARDDDASVFEVPARVNEDMTVVGTTVAMSEPHDIEYTVHISIGEAIDEAETPAGDAEQTAVPLAGRNRELPGLTWQREMPLRYAHEFAVDYYDGGYKLLSIADGGRYLVVPEGGEVPDELDAGVRVICQPVRHIYLAATAAMALFDALDALDAVRLSGTRQEGWTVENAAAAMARGDMLYAGKYSAPDYELMLSEGCDLAIESTMILHAPKVREMLEALGIPVLVERSSGETHPLGRTEWVKLYGALLNAEDRAEAFFDSQAQVVDALEDFPDTKQTVAFFYVASDGSVVVRGARDYVARMIELAGGRYVFDALTAGEGLRASVPVSMEDFYAAAVDAEFLVYNGAIDEPLECVDDLLGKGAVFADFRAVKEGNVFTTDRSLYQATDAVGELIADLNRMLRGEAEGMRFLRKVC